MKTITTTTTQHYHIFTLSVPSVNSNKTGFKSAIVSSVYLEQLKINKELFLQRMHALNLRNITLIFIDDLHEKIETRKLFQQFGPTVCILSIIVMNSNHFFSFSSFEYFFSENKEKNFEVVFAIRGKTWHEICLLFNSTMVDISGGSNKKKYLLSPNQFRLSQFLSCLQASSAVLTVSESFHKDIENPEEGDNKDINYSKKKQQEKIINFAQTQDFLKSRLLSDHTEEFHGIKEFINKKIKRTNSITSRNKSNNTIDSALIHMNQSTHTVTPSPSHQPSLRNQDKIILQNTEQREEHTPIQNNNFTLLPSDQGQKQNGDMDKELGQRKFHTSAYIFNSNKLNDLSIVPQPPTSVKNNTLIEKKSIISEYLDSVKQIVEDAFNGDISQREAAQLKFENTWIELIEKHLKDERFFINRHQSLLLTSLFAAKETLDSMSENNYLSKKFPQLGDELNKIDYLIITFSLCISLYPRLAYNALALKVGEEILYLNYKNKYLRKTRKKVKEGKENSKIKTISFEEYKKELTKDSSFVLILGDFFMSILQRFPHEIFNRKIKLNSYFTQEPFLLEINQEYLEDVKNNLIINPNTLPMLCQPVKWSESDFGGYLFNKSRENDIITGSKEFAHTIENKDSIYQAVNYLNSIKFGVNTNLINYLLSAEGSYILEMIKPDDALQRAITIKVAELYKAGYFFLNAHADWRGRLYTQSFYISYQAGDLSSALLNFWEGEPINSEGKFYLYIYGANSHNENSISKASFTDRLKWVTDNYNRIINLDRDLILSAESPFIFTAFCLNMKEIHNNPNAIIKTPVFLDATCSGIQHLAALMKDLELGSNTNLLPSTNNDKPGDIYSILLDPINKAINKYGEENLEYAMLSLVKLNRSLVKPSIMTKVYNVTVYGIAQQLQWLLDKSFNKTQDLASFQKQFINSPLLCVQESLEKSLKSNKSKTRFTCPAKVGKDITLSKKEIFKIADIINEQIFVVFPSLNNIYNYFIEMTKLSIKLSIPITWIAPSGLKITQNYRKKRKKVVSVSIFGKSKKMVLRINEHKINNDKQSQAIIPNIIHSLDASHLINLIKSASEDKFGPIITIHDCFGTLPNQMGELEHRVKKEFILLYSDSQFLNNYHNRFIQNIVDNQYEIITENGKSYVFLNPEEPNLEIPSIPKLGDLDIENIIKSKYMIS